MVARRPASTRSAAEPPPPAPVRIARIGAEGDGIGALASGAPVYVAGALPGELIQARFLARRAEGWVAEADAVLEAAAARAEPPCRHFGACGGCALQHWQDEAYAAWKTSLLIDALRRAGFPEASVGPLARTPPRGRRRMDLALRRNGRTATVGLHRRGRAEVIDLAECPILHPALFALLAPLREALGGLHGLVRDGSALVNLLDAGPDLLLRTDGPLSAADRAALAGFAAVNRLPRVSWALGDAAPETACLLRPATTLLSGVPVEPPPGAFLQASAEGEAAILGAVLAGLPERMPPRARIVELYAGCGTITFALAARARVQAFEGDAAAHAALRKAAGGRRVEAIRRDLSRQPVMAAELKGVAAVVLDPPFAGAAGQVTQIAASGVPRVVYVSCHPAALARDARALREAGYRIVAATPVDQFLWSARLESVVVFAPA